MKASEYQKLAMRTNDGKSTERLESFIQEESAIDCGGLINGCLGLSGEAGEFNDIVKKWIFHKTKPDSEHMSKEIGDVCWYIAMICESMNLDAGEIMEKNIEKLRKRYPEGFDEVRANNRSKDDI